MGHKTSTYGAGQYLFRQGEKGGELFVIKKGRVELTVQSKESGESAVVSICEVNSVIGTMSFMEGEPRSATAKALVDTECIVVNQQQREKLMSEVPEWFKVLVKDMAANLRILNGKYADLQNLHHQVERRLQNYMKKQNDGKSEPKT